jgi:hypothetical protein
LLFINEDRVRVEIRAAKEPLYDLAGNMVAEEKKALHAQFIRNVAPSWAVDYAETIFEFPTKQEGVTTAEWLSAYDSLNAAREFGWTPEEREFIEQTLLQRGYVMVEAPALMPPWPRYGDIVASRDFTGGQVVEAIIDIIIATGVDARVVREYERLTEARPFVLEALDAHLGVVPETEEDQGPLIAA